MTEPASNIAEISVSELSQALKRTVETAFSYVRVRGEISGFKPHSSGHWYFALKDDQAVIDAVMWRGTNSRIAFRPEDGLEVVATGKLTTYPGRSKYQLVVEYMEPAGVGALLAQLEARKKALAAEGLFDPARKKAIPYLPKVIGVITSPTGAVIRDILHRLNDRFPRHVLLWPVKVQGEGTENEVVAAIRGFNAMDGAHGIPRPDLLIVARGGGSVEDLWAFNSESIVRAVASSDIPVISAVGHETDTTLIDYASDKRAPTPTAAAEMAVPVKADLEATLADLSRRLDAARRRHLDRLDERLKGLARALPKPDALLGLKAQQLDELTRRLPNALALVASKRHRSFDAVALRLTPVSLKSALALRRQRLVSISQRMDPAFARWREKLATRLDSASRMLTSLSYHRVLERGFAVVHDASGKPLTSAIGLAPGTGLDIEFRDGRVPVAVTSTQALHRAGQPKPTPEPKKPGQGELF